MKIKVYSLASDGDDGTRATVFGTEAELHAAMREAIEEDIDVTENAGAIRLLLEAGDIKAAWSDWQKFTPKFFRYEKGEHEIEIDLPNVFERLIEKVARANGIQHSGGEVLAEDWAELYQLTNEAKSISPAPPVAA